MYAEIMKLQRAGFTVEEIATMLGARRATVRKTIRRLTAQERAVKKRLRDERNAT